MSENRILEESLGSDERLVSNPRKQTATYFTVERELRDLVSFQRYL
jgi:hypothetical protein